MKFYTILSILTIVFYSFLGCSKESNSSVENAGLDTLSIMTSMKGWELYSWQSGDVWNYSFLYGTNRGKSTEEIKFTTKSSAQIVLVHSVNDVEYVIGKLDHEEGMVWLGCEKNQLNLPPQTVIDDIQQYCKSINMNLYVYPCN